MDSPDSQYGRSAARPIRVLVPFNTPYLYGMERAVLDLFSAVRPEIEAHFVSAESFRRSRLPVVKEIEARDFAHSFLPDGDGGWPPLGRPKSLAHAWKLARTISLGNIFVLTRGSFEAIYIPSATYVHGWAAAARMRMRGLPVIYHCHDLRPPLDALKLWYPLITHYVFSTETARAIATQHAPSMLRRANAVFPLIVPSPPEPFAKEDPALRIVYVGQISLHKGIDLLIEAFERLAPTYPNAELHLVGGIATNFADQFERLLSASGVRTRIHAWGYRSDYKEILRSAIVYVQASPPTRVQEAFGRTVVEALACGLPIICFPSGSLCEIVKDHVNGIICKDESGAALAKCIGIVFENPELRHQLARGAAESFARFYSPEVTRKYWLGFFEGAILPGCPLSHPSKCERTS